MAQSKYLIHPISSIAYSLKQKLKILFVDGIGRVGHSVYQNFVDQAIVKLVENWPVLSLWGSLISNADCCLNQLTSLAAGSVS